MFSLHFKLTLGLLLSVLFIFIKTSFQIIYIVIGIVAVIILGLIIVLAMHCRERRAAHRRQLIEQTNHVVLKPKNTDNHNIYKRNSKMSNLEASQVNKSLDFKHPVKDFLLCTHMCVCAHGCENVIR